MTDTCEEEGLAHSHVTNLQCAVFCFAASFLITPVWMLRGCNRFWNEEWGSFELLQWSCVPALLALTTTGLFCFSTDRRLTRFKYLSIFLAGWGQALLGLLLNSEPLQGAGFCMILFSPAWVAEILRVEAVRRRRDTCAQFFMAWNGSLVFVLWINYFNSGAYILGFFLLWLALFAALLKFGFDLDKMLKESPRSVEQV